MKIINRYPFAYHTNELEEAVESLLTFGRLRECWTSCRDEALHTPRKI